MHFLIITFGENEQNHFQAYFCVHSLLARKAALSSINIFTDKPQFYERIKEHVSITVLSDEMLKDWRGPYDYFWRIKIKALETLCLRHPGEPVLYTDSDVFLFGDFEQAHTIVQSGNAGMHEDEGVVNTFRQKTHRSMTKDLKNITIEGISGFGSLHMWNAGAILSPNTNGADEFKLALRLTDEMCRLDVKRNFVEQFCVSVAMNKFYSLVPLRSFLAHYWSNRPEWNAEMNKFYLKVFAKQLTDEQILEEFMKFPFEKIPYRSIKKNTGVRLKKTIDKYFPDKNIDHLKM